MVYISSHAQVLQVILYEKVVLHTVQYMLHPCSTVLQAFCSTVDVSSQLFNVNRQVDFANYSNCENIQTYENSHCMGEVQFVEYGVQLEGTLDVSYTAVCCMYADSGQSFYCCPFNQLRICPFKSSESIFKYSYCLLAFMAFSDNDLAKMPSVFFFFF